MDFKKIFIYFQFSHIILQYFQLSTSKPGILGSVFCDIMVQFQVKMEHIKLISKTNDFKSNHSSTNEDIKSTK